MSPSTLLALCVATLLVLLGLRRVFSAAHAFGPTPNLPPEATAPVLLLAPMRNEAARAHFLLNALDQLDFPPAMLQIVLGDDASQDRTPAILHAWAQTKPNVQIFSASTPMGKAELMNCMIQFSPCQAGLIAVYDAKHSPDPNSLRLLVGAMHDPQVGCVAGYLRPANAQSTLVSRYAALESWVTQLVHHAANEQRGVSSPSMGGNCIYRRQALLAAGGFPPASFSEDTEVSLAMQELGWRTRFVPGALASNRVVETVSSFWKQRLRWSEGLKRARKRATGLRQKHQAIGYLDRLLLLLAAALVLTGYLPWWVLLAYAFTPLLMVFAAIHKAGQWRHAPAIFLSLLLCAPLDIAVTAWSMLPWRRIGWR